MDMEGKPEPRSPKQARSRQTKETVLATAYRLFCKKGYYNTTTNEIAREAGVPIGSLYAYFKDKDTLFLEILERYHEEFVKSNEVLYRMIDVYLSDMKTWLRKLIENLVEIHERSRDLNREKMILCFYNPDVAEFTRRQREESMLSVLDNLRRMKIEKRDLEAAALVVYDTVSAVVDRIAFGDYAIGRDRIIDACAEEVYSYLHNRADLPPGG
jgi:AcrR family transcriptional regulator